MKKNNSLFGIFLIFVGIYLLLERLELIDGDIFLLLLGCTFVATYFIKRRTLGYLIPGAILTWLGIYTVVVEENFWPALEDYSGGLFFLALGFAFFTIFIHTYFRQGQSWPLIPGLGLIIFALVVEFEFSFIPEKYLDYIDTYWPAGLIILGLTILGVSYNRKDESE